MTPSKLLGLAKVPSVLVNIFDISWHLQTRGRNIKIKVVIKCNYQRWTISTFWSKKECTKIKHDTFHFSFYLEKHLDAKDESEHMVHSVQNLSLQRPGRNVGPLHGECDAVTGDEYQNQEVEPALGGQGLTLEAEPEEWWHNYFMEYTTCRWRFYYSISLVDIRRHWAHEFIVLTLCCNGGVGEYIKRRKKLLIK